MKIAVPETGVAGYYSFLINGEPVSPVECKNLITDFGFSRMLNTSSFTIPDLQVSVGTSNTPPAFTDTALGSPLASVLGSGSATATSGTDTVGTYVGQRVSFAFAQGAVIGNVAEVGMKFASGDSSLSSRSLVKDAGGNPTVVVVTAIDQLTVQYELRQYLNLTLSTSGTTTVAGVSTNWVLMSAGGAGNFVTDAFFGLNPANMDQTVYGNTFVMGAVGTPPTGNAVTNNTQNITNKVVSVTGGTGTVAFTISWSTSTGNSVGGVYGLLIVPGGTAGLALRPQAGWGATKLSFTPQIPKDNTKTLAMHFTFTFVRV